MLGVACPECHGSGGGKNTKRAFVGLESTWMLYTTTCSACKGSGYEFKSLVTRNISDHESLHISLRSSNEAIKEGRSKKTIDYFINP